MNQGKLDVVKQEMVRININILAISELKWTRMGELNPDDHCIYCIYYCGQKSHGELMMTSQLINSKTGILAQVT